jgi:hypothetical protein
MFCFPQPCMAGELEYALSSIAPYGWGAGICSVFNSHVLLGS